MVGKESGARDRLVMGWRTGIRCGEPAGFCYGELRGAVRRSRRFLSRNTIATPSGSMDGTALKPLTTDLHEPGVLTTLNAESAAPFWFQLSDQQRQQLGAPWGSANPQALNR